MDQPNANTMPGAAAAGFEADRLEGPDRARKGDLGVKGLPDPKSSFERGSTYQPFKSLQGGK